MIDNATSKTVGGYISAKLKEARLAQDLTLFRLQEMTGIAACNLSRIENEQVCPRIDTLHAICKALGLEISFPLPV